MSNYCTICKIYTRPVPSGKSLYHCNNCTGHYFNCSGSKAKNICPHCTSACSDCGRRFTTSSMYRGYGGLFCASCDVSTFHSSNR